MAWSGKGIKCLNSDCRKLSWSSLWSVPSPSLQVTLKWKDHLMTAIQNGVGSWANGPTGTSWNSARINTKSCPCEGRGPYNVMGWGFWAALLRRTWGDAGRWKAGVCPGNKEHPGGTGRSGKVVILLCTVPDRSLLEACNKFWVQERCWSAVFQKWNSIAIWLNKLIKIFLSVSVTFVVPVAKEIVIFGINVHLLCLVLMLIMCQCHQYSFC